MARRGDYGVVTLPTFLLREMVADGVRGANREIRAVMASIAANVGDLDDIRKANRGLAAEMRVAVIDAYEQSQARKKVRDSYREGQNRLPGTLGHALKNPDMAIGTQGGFLFVDTELLDKEARHWKRLNFGVEPTTDPGSRPYTLRIGDQALLDVGFNIGPRPPMELPVGFFDHGGSFQAPNPAFRGNSQFAFYPTGSKKISTTSGFEGRHFLEAGLERLERRLPEVYDDMIQGWLTRRSRGAKAAQRAYRSR